MKSKKQIKDEKGKHPVVKKDCPQCECQMQVFSVVTDGDKKRQVDKCPMCGQSDVSETTKLKEEGK